MDKLKFAGHQDHAVRITCRGLQIPGRPRQADAATIDLTDPAQWTKFIVDGTYQVYASRQGGKWRFIASDPNLGDYIMRSNPDSCRTGSLTLHLPDTANGRHTVAAAPAQ